MYIYIHIYILYVYIYIYTYLFIYLLIYLQWCAHIPYYRCSHSVGTVYPLILPEKARRMHRLFNIYYMDATNPLHEHSSEKSKHGCSRTIV